MDDLISRQMLLEYIHGEPVGRLLCDKYNLDGLIEQLPSARSETFEWCTNCKEYDQEAHCCHRWSKMIRKTVEEMQIVRCKDCRYYNAEEKECLDLLGYGRRWEEGDFCSYAERRTDE